MNLALRAGSAAVGIPLILLLIFYRETFYGVYPFYLFVLALVALGAREAGDLLAAGSSAKPRRRLYAGLALAMALGSFGAVDVTLPHRANWTGCITPAEWLVLILFAALLLVLGRRLARGEVAGTVGDAGQALLLLAMLALPASFLALTYRLPQGSWVLLLVFLCTWAMDTGGYFAGRFFGRTKLAPIVSPKKTIEGFAGGLAAAVAVALLLKYGAGDKLPFAYGETFLLGLVFALAGQLGDLAESLVKRDMQVKDSGGLIPGHGGVLDRFDALLLNAPLAYLYYIVVAVH